MSRNHSSGSGLGQQSGAAAASSAGCCNGSVGGAAGPLLRPHHCDLVATLRSLARPLRAAEEAERLAQLHRSKIKRLRAVSRHLEAELARRKVLKCDRQVQTEAGFVNPYTRAFASRTSTGAAATMSAPVAPVASAPAMGAAAAPASVTIDLTRERHGVPPRPPPGPPAGTLAALPVCLKMAPLLTLRADPTDRQSAELHWRLRGLTHDQCSQITGYSVWYCYQRQGHPADAWAKTADLHALTLPMRCQVSLDPTRGACHFVLRAEDRLGRAGLWSNVVSWPNPPSVSVANRGLP